MIVAESLSKYYGSHKAIENVNFEIGEGEIVGLLGLNGAGKSTILKILGCFLMPSGGTARVAGYAVDKNPHEIRKLIGYLPDTPPLYDEMDVESYLVYVARLKNVASRDIAAGVERVCAMTNITDMKDVRLGELSHGYRQRVGIAQALVHDPKVIILDEPINGLDPIQIVEMRDLILSLKGRHTVVLSSHILSEITRTCDRVMIIDQGRLVAQGAEADLQKGVTQNMQLTLDLENPAGELVGKLRTLTGVVTVETATAPFGGYRLVLDTDRDVRSAVARTVIQDGNGLLSLNRSQEGLEGVFMKMIGTEVKGGEAKLAEGQRHG